MFRYYCTYINDQTLVLMHSRTLLYVLPGFEIGSTSRNHCIYTARSTYTHILNHIIKYLNTIPDQHTSHLTLCKPLRCMHTEWLSVVFHGNWNCDLDHVGIWRRHQNDNDDDTVNARKFIGFPFLFQVNDVHTPTYVGNSIITCRYSHYTISYESYGLC